MRHSGKRARLRQITFRLAPELIERLDAHARALRVESPGLTVSRTDAVRLLLERGLSAAGLGRSD